MQESSGQFFRTTTKIQSGPDAFDKSRFIMTFLTIFRVSEILCSFKWVLEGETGKKIPESSELEKFSAKNFPLSDEEDNTSGPSNIGGIADLPLLRTLLAIPQKSRGPSFWEVMAFYFISICKFGSFKNPFAAITSLSELYFKIRRFILLLETKKVISMNYGSSTRSWNSWRWMRLDKIFSMRDIYINSNLNPILKFISSSRSTELKEILPWIFFFF